MEKNSKTKDGWAADKTVQDTQDVTDHHDVETKWLLPAYVHGGPASSIQVKQAVLRIHMFLGLPDSGPLGRGMDQDPDPSIIKQKNCQKNLDSYCFVTFFFEKLCKCTFKK